jgi:hypothetical protein
MLERSRSAPCSWLRGWGARLSTPCWRCWLSTVCGSAKPVGPGSSRWALNGATAPHRAAQGRQDRTIPLAPRTARAVDLAIGERCERWIFISVDGRRLDRHGAARMVRRVARQAGTTKPVEHHTLRHAFITVVRRQPTPPRRPGGCQARRPPYHHALAPAACHALTAARHGRYADSLAGLRSARLRGAFDDPSSLVTRVSAGSACSSLPQMALTSTRTSA